MRFCVLVLVAACRFGFDTTDATTNASAQLQLNVSAPGLMIVNADARVDFATLDPNALSAVPSFPGTVLLAVPDVSGTATVTVDGVDNRGRVFTATSTANMVAGSGGNTSIVLGADLTAACSDGITDAGETDVDCGAACPACGVGSVCFINSDCITGNCSNGYCEPATGPPTWVRVADAPRGRIGAAAVTALDGHIYVYGGSMDDAVMKYAEVDVYDPLRDLWGSAPPLPTPRERIAGAIDSAGIMYAIGGTSSAVVERYAPGDGAWTTAPALPLARGFLAAAQDKNGAVHAIGGGPTQTAEHDLLGASWTTKAPLPAATSNLAAARASNGALLAVGGKTGVYLTTVLAYDPASDTWTAQPSLNHARSDLCAALGGDGRVYAIGGFDGSFGLLFVEASRAASPWVTVPSTTVARDSCAAAAAPDGRVLVFSGRAVTTGNVEVEAYGPKLRLGAASGSGGDTLTVQGTNFAANAAVRIHFDATPVERTTTDATGQFSTSIVIPATSSGPHTIHAGDDKAKFPVAYPFAVL